MKRKSDPEKGAHNWHEKTKKSFDPQKMASWKGT
jgi:hypothetical protein